MIVVSQLSQYSVTSTEPHNDMVEFLDEAVRSLAKNFALTDVSDGVAFLRRIRQDLREEQGGQHRWDKDHPLRGRVVEGWAVQELTTGQACIFYAVLVKGGKLALAQQGDLEKDVTH